MIKTEWHDFGTIIFLGYEPDEPQRALPPGEIRIEPRGYGEVFTDRAELLKSIAHDDAIDILAEPCWSYFEFETYEKCLAGVRRIILTQPIPEHRERGRKALHILLRAAFIGEHDLTDEEFTTDHWQSIFRIQYPEVRS
ncbi:hypothetical protein [Sphingomonas sp. Leaf242]|uniref:hypothetical protein n=1 Tax=Sphingomonas sp. Leaf242 TaxID=1736304 RepID=UPI0007160EB1|nr:hypothetical protein [Sphingomonas sp. Leaf242]KQO06921.1 hypothetical protein ASF09_11715 [Sphingomonas sp. Leaf242]